MNAPVHKTIRSGFQPLHGVDPHHAHQEPANAVEVVCAISAGLLFLAAMGFVLFIVVG